MKKNVAIIFVVITVAVALFLYYSPANRTERNYVAMLEQGQPDLAILEAYMQFHEPMDDVGYNRALNQAALLDDRYLQKVVERYARGSFILFMD